MTSTNGVTLISEREVPMRVLDEEGDKDWGLTAMKSFGDIQKFERKILHVGDELLDSVEEIIVGDDGGDRGDQPKGGGDQCLSDPWRNRDQAGRANDTDSLKRIHDPPDRAEQPDERGDASCRCQKAHHFLQARDLGIGGLCQDPAQAFHPAGIDGILRVGTGDMSEFLEPGLKESHKRAAPVFFGRIIHFGKVLTFAERPEELLRLGERCLDCPSLEKDDRPGKNGEEEENEQNQLDDRAGISDQSKNIHRFDSKSSTGRSDCQISERVQLRARLTKTIGL